MHLLLIVAPVPLAATLFEDTELPMVSSLLQTGLQRSERVSETSYVSEIETRTLTDAVTRAYYINLDGEDSAPRRANMELQLSELEKAFGLHYERYPAVYGADDETCQAYINDDILTDPRYTDTKIPITWEELNGTLGCQQSHVRLWKKIYDEHDESSSAPWAMIFEDDAQPEVEGLAELTERLLTVPYEADMVLMRIKGIPRCRDYAGSGAFRATGNPGGQAYLELVPSVGLEILNGLGYWDYTGTDSYIVRIDRIPAMIEFVESPRAPSLHIDHATMYNVREIRKYAFIPMLVQLSEGAVTSVRTGETYVTPSPAKAWVKDLITCLPP